MQEVKLKICGITTLDDALTSIECGAQYLGFNFYPASPRYITPDDAGEIIDQLPKTVTSVGVFVNELSPRYVLSKLEISGATMAQLHGDETPEFCDGVGAKRVIKALRIDAGFVVRRVLDYPAAVILLDAYDRESYGGTGRTTDWYVASEAAQMVKLFLAGGLSPDNVVEAIRTVQPFGIDVNSGVEVSPGIKDPVKLKRLKEELLHCKL